MYKVSEVAELLGVSKVEVFEKLISYSDELKPYVRKQKGVTFIDESGVGLLRKLILGNQVQMEDVIEAGESQAEVVSANVQPSLDSIEHVEEAMDPNPENGSDDSVVAELEVTVEEYHKPFEIDVEVTAELPSERDTTLDFESTITAIVERRSELHEKIMDLKIKLNSVDQELRKKDSAIVHYQSLLKDDIEWITEAEQKIDMLRTSEELFSEKENDIEEKSFLGLFKSKK